MNVRNCSRGSSFHKEHIHIFQNLKLLSASLDPLFVVEKLTEEWRSGLCLVDVYAIIVVSN